MAQFSEKDSLIARFLAAFSASFSCVGPLLLLSLYTPGDDKTTPETLTDVTKDAGISPTARK